MAKATNVIKHLRVQISDLIYDNAALRAEVDELTEQVRELKVQLESKLMAESLDNQQEDPLQSLYQEDSKDL
jgi:regulator of replication initiation timing